MKAIISQPMRGRSTEYIRKEREAAVKYLEDQGIEVVDTVFEDFSKDLSYKNVPLAYLAKSLEQIAQVDVVYFMPGWDEARGCKFERQCCIAYGVPIEHL